jgi:DeoR/GlpR family transcriptional regulator of sugar metabolism
MLHIEREIEIIDILNKRGSVTVRELVERFDVTEVTVRRDLQKLEERNLLRRTHGGAIKIDGVSTRLLRESAPSSIVSNDIQVDALILAPVQNRVAHTLRERALRSRIPLLAESVGFEGAIYLGPDNYHGALDLGRWTGAYLRQQQISQPHVLDITSDLPNGHERSSGFTDGLRSVLGEIASVLTVDGRAVYNAAYQVVYDALRIHPEINVLFGVNDDLILGAIQAALDLGRDPDSFLAVNVGGEGKTLFDTLQQRGPLKACLALFPEVVGRAGIDAALRLWAGEDIGADIITPSTVLTADNVSDYYKSVKQDWLVDLSAVEQLEQTRWQTPLPPPRHQCVSFVIHFRTHEWYQNIAKAMHERARQVGITLMVQDVNEDLKAEISELRRLIGKKAASYVSEGETIILDSGSTTANMAHFLDKHRNLTVITNSAAVFQHLQRNLNVRLILTGGEFHPESQAFVGRGAHLHLQEIRADKVFLVAGGLTANFGLSSKNQQEAEVRRAMISAAREVVVLADHTVLGVDSHSFVVGLERVHTLITDAGILSEDRLDFNQRGITVIVADEVCSARR